MNKKAVIWDFSGTLSKPDFDIFEVVVRDKGLDFEEKLRYRNEVQAKLDKEYDHFPLGTFVVMMSKDSEEYGDHVDPDLRGVTKEELEHYSKKIEMRKGWERILSEVSERGMVNYLLSSDLKTVVQNSSLNLSHFEEIYCSELEYNNEGKIIDFKDDNGCKKAVGPRRKIKKLKDILGGSDLDLEDIYYIGDGFTDKDVVKYVDENGGVSICVGENDRAMENATWTVNGGLMRYKGKDLKEILGDQVKFEDGRVKKDIERRGLSEDEVIYEKIKGILGSY